MRSLLVAVAGLVVSGCAITASDPVAPDEYSSNLLVHDISYRDLIAIVYRTASSDTNVTGLVSLPPPSLGYEFQMSGLRGEVRIRPVTGLNQERRVVAGHVVEYRLNGVVWMPKLRGVPEDRILPFLRLRGHIEESLAFTRYPVSQVRYADL